MGRKIRKAKPTDITDIMQVMEAAKGIMRSAGNMNQWTDGYPSETVIFSDIERNGGFVVLDEDEIVGYFDILSKYDDSENPYDAYPRTEADKLRGDTVVEGLEISDVKKVSENFMDGYFQVPKVLGEGA